MPRPPILPAVDWKSLFARGLTFEAWLQAAELPEHVLKMRSILAEQAIPDDAMYFLSLVSRPVHVIAYAEDWCGDVVRHAPVLAKLAEQCKHIQVRFVARSDSPDTFCRFLTNGGEAVPKFVFFNDKWVECGNWGPMEARARELIARGKACGDVSAARKKVSAIYAADPGRWVVARELAEMAALASCLEP